MRVELGKIVLHDATMMMKCARGVARVKVEPRYTEKEDCVTEVRRYDALLTHWFWESRSLICQV
jgi:hypothetical protein